MFDFLAMNEIESAAVAFWLAESVNIVVIQLSMNAFYTVVH